ncbi:hypothetical protein FHT36_000763 [Xanthobacter sp. SG618]|uniref:hypothetical protein n=1 Tax=Xanthobacter sp. SG618 TaxID=2587121 RepID=UPI00145EFD63|nr:hypothetical protein [Xanthobacter sp. SG618]NMN56885.1 hypothetical protein [Xanthobacter sp. SG618]
MRREPCYARRELAPIERVVWRIRTLQPFRPLVLVDGQRPALTLDRVENVTLARVRFLERRGVA